MKLARSIQKPGQTKEQTKLVAQGIAKGIAQYKKQQSAKARERDKARKRALKQRQAEQESRSREEEVGLVMESGGDGDSVVWWSSAALLGLLTVLHLIPLLMGWSLSLGSRVLPVWVLGMLVCLYAGGASYFVFRALKTRKAI